MKLTQSEQSTWDRLVEVWDLASRIEDEDPSPLELPLLMVEQQGRTGLSPWGLAAITGFSPRRVLRLLERSEARACLCHCCTTHLPIVQYSRWDKRWTTYHDDDLISLIKDEAYPDELTTAEVEASKEWKKWNLTSQLRRFAGSDWKKYAKDDFNPWGGVNPFEPGFWNAARTLYKLRRKQLRGGRVGA